MKTNRKGLSDVVSTVLIILLVVAAIAIIGAIVLNVVNNGGKNVNSALACQQLDLKPVSCKLNGAVSANGTAQLNALPTGASINNVSFVFEKVDKTTNVSSSGAITQIGGTVNSINVAGVYTNLQVGATLKLADGTTTTCAPKESEKIACA